MARAGRRGRVEQRTHPTTVRLQQGISRALNVFRGSREAPTYQLVEPVSGARQRMVRRRRCLASRWLRAAHCAALLQVVRSETLLVRPFVVCAVLRGVQFNEARYNSFIDLQDKLHQNICRKRTLVAIGTHDLDTLQGPFTYEALPPEVRAPPFTGTLGGSPDGCGMWCALAGYSLCAAQAGARVQR